MQEFNEKEFMEQLTRFRGWLKVNAIGRAIKGFLPTFIDGDSRKYTLIVDDRLQPRTDGTNIWISLLPPFLKDEYSTDDWLVVLRAATAHEAQHINSSNFNDVKAVSDWYGKYLNENFQLDEAIGKPIARDVLNIVEDGRIESIAVKRRPGMLVPFLFLNELIREGTAIEKKAENEQEEYRHFIGQLLSYSKTGLYAPGIKTYENTNLEVNFLAIRSLIDDGVNARTSADCRETVELLLSEVSPYLAALISSSEELQNELKQDNKQPEYTSNNENQFNESQKNKTEESQSSSEQCSSNQTDQNQNQNGNPLRQNNPCKNNNGQQNGSSENGNNNQQFQGNGSQNVNSQNNGSQDGNSQNSGSQGNNSQGNNNSGNDSNSQSQDNSGSNSLTDSQGTNYGFGNAKEENAPVSKEKLDEIRQLVSSEISSANKAEKSETNGKNSAQIDPAMIEEVQAAYKGHTPEIKVTSPKITHSEPLPPEFNMQALVLQREIKKIIQSKQAQQKYMARGLLDTKSLWRAGIADDKLFYRKRNPDKGSCAFYFLLDNSGSMHETVLVNNGKTLKKYEAARSAAAVIEQAACSLIPCKIALFHTSGGVSHIVIRNFDDKTRVNQSWNSLLDIGPSGCNADSVHIRLAAKELMRRTEKKKVLFVLSDGLPSNYGSQFEALEEVREAVNYARHNGVIVIPIMFGDESFLKEASDVYKRMYEKNIIACLPQQITSKLVQLFRTILVK